MENTKITKEAYENLITTNIEFEKMDAKCGIDGEDLKKLNLQAPAENKDNLDTYGNTYAHHSIKSELSRKPLC